MENTDASVAPETGKQARKILFLCEDLSFVPSECHSTSHTILFMAHRTHGMHRGIHIIGSQKEFREICDICGKIFKPRGKQKSVGVSAVAVYLAMYAVVDVVCVEVY